MLTSTFILDFLNLLTKSNNINVIDNELKEEVRLGKGNRIAHINVRDIMSSNKKDDIRVLLEIHSSDILA